MQARSLKEISFSELTYNIEELANKKIFTHLPKNRFLKTLFLIQLSKKQIAFQSLFLEELQLMLLYKRNSKP